MTVHAHSAPTCAGRRARHVHRRPAATPRRHRNPNCATGQTTRLGAYRDRLGRRRELVSLSARGGSTLVVDRDAATLRDRFLLAHIAAEEPAINAELVCRDYLSRPDGRRCRRLRAGDLLSIPTGENARCDLAVEPALIDANGCSYRLHPVYGRNGRAELRWCHSNSQDSPGWEPLSLRQLLSVLERYEPARTLTAAAIVRYRHDRAVSVRQLRGEYRWLCSSPVVLNRAVREAVLRVTGSGQLSMSEIALRCGIFKRDRHGGRTGETSWLARRVGLMPEGGARHVTPWIHSDVLALIAREGLRVSPHEVEVP